MACRTLGRRNAAPVQSTELDLTSFAHAQHEETIPEKATAEELFAPRPSVHRDLSWEDLPQDLGHGRLTDFAERYGEVAPARRGPYGLRTISDVLE